MGKMIEHTVLDATLTLSEMTDGFWLYDKTQGMNIAMRYKSKEEALFKALKYHQQRHIELKAELRELQQKVDNFVSLFVEEQND